MINRDGASFLEILGGEAGCQLLSRDFYGRVAQSAELKPLFPGKSVRCATEEFAAFLIQFLEGDQDQTQHRWWLSLRESHARFKISELQRSVWLRLMVETIDSLIVDSKIRQSLKQFFGATSGYLLGNNEGAPAHKELNERWCNQLTLDQLVEDITNGRDSEAIVHSRQFAHRHSVFVGILARMMETGHEPLLDFVVSSIEGDHQLSTSRFNGRPLLHFAAGSSCMPVVRKLLELGADPDVMDSGSHSTLYRASTAEIVAELVRAGASVNHCGGVNKSTALHQAARFGNLAVAQALLDAGANQSAKDRKGLTPLDRAINCRRHDVAALLVGRSL